MRHETQKQQITESLTTSPKDIALIRRAINAGWNIPESFYEKLPQAIYEIAMSDEVEPKDRISASKTIISMVAQNQKQNPVQRQPIRHEHVITTEDNLEHRRAIALARITGIREDSR